MNIKEALEQCDQNIGRCEEAIQDPKTSLTERDQLRVQLVSYGLEKQAMLIHVLWGKVLNLEKQLARTPEDLEALQKAQEKRDRKAVKYEGPTIVQNEVVPEFPDSLPPQLP